MSDLPPRPPFRKRTPLPTGITVKRRPPSPPAASHRPMWPWFLMGASVAGLCALLVAGAIIAIVLNRPAREHVDLVVGPAPAAATPPKAADKPSWPGPDRDEDDSSIPDPPVGPRTVRIEYTSTLDAVGNGETAVETKLTPELVERFRRRLSRYLLSAGPRERPPTAKNYLGMIDADAEDFVMENIEGEFTPTAIRAKFHAAGRARGRAGKWVVLLSHDEPFQLVKKHNSRVVTLRRMKRTPEFNIVTQIVLTLPEGARDIEVTPNPNELLYRLPEPAAKMVTVQREPSFDVVVKPHILGALAKQYADPRRGKYWPARSILRNRSGQTLTDYRVRFRIPRFAGTWSEWSSTETIFPDQVVVDTFRPRLDSAKIALLKTAEPVDVEVEYEYVAADGKKTSAKKTAVTKILPMNEAVYSDIHFDADTTWLEAFKDVGEVVATFVTPKDPVVQQLIGEIGYEVGVKKFPLQNEKDAIRFLKGLWALMRTNIYYYQHKQAGITDGFHTDRLMHQYLMYPRDVLRAKRALCVNTAILVASVAEGAGLKSYIVVIPHHAFPVIRLPGGKKALAIESTLIGGGTLGSSGSFAEACMTGEREAANAMKDLIFIQVDIEDRQKSGVVPPELPDLKEGLADWDISPPMHKEEGAVEVGPVRRAPKGATATVPMSLVNDEVTKDGRRGAVIVLSGLISHAKDCPCVIGVILKNQAGDIVKTRDRTVSDSDGNLCVATTVIPDSDKFFMHDIHLFIPDAALPNGRTGETYTGVVLVMNEGRALNNPRSISATFKFTR